MTLPLLPPPLHPGPELASNQEPKRQAPVSDADAKQPLTQHTASIGLTELLASAPRQHALRLNPPTPTQAQPTAASQARHAHD